MFFTLFSTLSNSQNEIKIKAEILNSGKNFSVYQEIKLYNTSSTSFDTVVLYDWNNAFSNKKSALALKFSDEFNRNFHFAKNKEKGFTTIQSIATSSGEKLTYSRNKNQVDLLKIKLNKSLEANDFIVIKINYLLQIPNAKFTKYGFSENKVYLKNFFLNITPIDCFQSEENSDDITNQKSNIFIEFIGNKYSVTTDLNSETETIFSGKDRTNFVFILEKNNTYKEYVNKQITTITNIKSKNINEYEKALIIDKITNYVSEKLGKSNIEKIVVSQEDYEREPFYGLNELPSFISPFNDDFVFELKFLKTYLNNYLLSNLNINFRQDHWILEGIQHYYIKKYIDENYPDMKAFGKLSHFRILKEYKLINMNFSEQFIYNYLLMARKNIDQPIGNDKNTLIKFNEKIAGKFKAGLSLHYLDKFLQNDIVENSMLEFVQTNKNQFTKTSDFKAILEKKSNQKLDWFFKNLIETNNRIDYKISKVKKDKDSIQITIKNLGEATVPFQLYEMKKDSVMSKKWYFNSKKEFTISLQRNNFDKLIINKDYESPEFNNNNNYYKLKNKLFGNKPLKFKLFKDIENPAKNQVFYIPSTEFNLYDGVLFGLRINNKSIINKPITFELNPSYSTKTNTLSGGVGFAINDFNRNSYFFNTRYGFSATTQHYSPDAFYTKITPSISFQFKNPNFRKNESEVVSIRNVYVNREKSAFIQTKNQENYSIFNIRYSKGKNELIKLFSYGTDLQLSKNFGKISGQILYRKLFENKRHITLRGFGGFFNYNDTNNDFFSFGLDRPSDYMFDYSLIGRSESTGLFSQQYVIADGAFKSKFTNRFANQYMFTLNGSFNIWNWIEAYGDVGMYKSKGSSTKYVYDSGIHLNLVQDYFELFFPVYSSNGFELNDNNYREKIRFVVTLTPKTLTSLFTRRWF